MRHYLLTAVAVLAIAFGATVAGDEIVITPDGTVYSVEMTVVDESTFPATTAITLSVQSGFEFSSSFIPGSVNGSLNAHPAIAWDNRSETLFVFWLRVDSIASSQLLFASMHDGVWSEPSKLDGGIFHYRSNLSITTTSVVTIADEDGEETKIPGLRVHAVWWDDEGSLSAARYALLTIEHGLVTAIERADLVDLVEPSGVFYDSDVDSKSLQKPSIRTNPAGDSVTVVFADFETRGIHAIDILPVGEGVLTIPIGVRPRAPEREFPQFESETSSLAPEFILSQQHPDRMIAWVRDGDLIRYREWEPEGWSEEKVVVINDRITSEAAIDALQRLIDATRHEGVLTIPIG